MKWVLSGINAGGNMGVDSYISGTVAAVREAAMHGIQGIAISQYKKKGLEFNWDNSTKWTAKLLADLFNRPLPPGNFWNVNLPASSTRSSGNQKSFFVVLVTNLCQLIIVPKARNFIT